MKKRILITGAAGFIGSSVAARLAQEGYAVTGADNLNPYYSVQLKRDRIDTLLMPADIECHQVELADEQQVHALFDVVRPDLVIHLAAQAGVRYSLMNPQWYFQANLLGFGNVIEASCRHDVGHFVYASSSSVYGNSTKAVLSETDVTDTPASLYAATKKSNEMMAHAYSQLYGLPATGLRFFTVYGPWGRPDMAYFSFTEKIRLGERIIAFSNGQLTRDYTYIDDIVEGVVRILQKPKPIEDGCTRHDIYNIGNNEPVSVLTLIRILEHIVGRRAHVEFGPIQAGDVWATCADISKLRNWIGFAPMTPLETGLRRFYEWLSIWSPHYPP